MKIAHLLSGAMLLALSVPALAATTPTSYKFTTTGNMSVSGTSGNALSFSAKTGTSTLQMQATAWQSNQFTNDITKAYLGAYSGGLGVTGYGDLDGNFGYHQVDSAGFYTDFILLQFNRAVSLTGAELSSYDLGFSTSHDNDFAYYNADAIVTPAWNTMVDLTSYDTVPSTWTTVGGNGSSGYRAINASAASTKWLVGAAFLPTTDRDDGFKIGSITVTESVSQAVTPVPEPASWAMMLAGFGAVGSAMRYRRKGTAVSFG